MDSEPSVYVISDSVGETAELVIKAGLSQFTNGDYQIHRIPYVEDEKTVDETLQIVKEKQGLIGFTIINPHLRHYIKTQAKQLNIEAIDIMGPVIEAMERTFSHQPRLEPGLVHKLDKDYFQRIEAIEFAVRYDDGRDPRGISRADIVLIGISRTSKTPLSQYLAHKRLKVANIPVVPEVELPEQLFEIDPTKCIGLQVNPENLNKIRKERLKALGLDDFASYATMDRIQDEIKYFNEVVEKIGCEVIDITNKAVEETANIILTTYKKNQVKRGYR